MWNRILKMSQKHMREHLVQEITDTILDERGCTCSPLALERLLSDGAGTTYFVDDVRGGLRCKRCHHLL